MPLLNFCHGKDCGATCAKFHSPCDEDVTGVILDVWSRGFFTTQGKSTKAPQADLFQCLLRVPACALETLLGAVHAGIYLEPRASTTKGPHPDFQVIWMAGLQRDQILHRLKTCTHGLGLARLHGRYGIRVRATLAERAHAELKPDSTFSAVKINQIYKLFPIPHGVKKDQLEALLKAWKWNARPLQAARGNHEGQSWTIGSADAPPQPVMQGFGGDILITLQKDTTVVQPEPQMVASQKTRRFLKEGAPAPSSGSGDPWLSGPDPWGGWKGTAPGKDVIPASTLKTTSAAAKRIDQLREELKPASAPPPGLEPMDDDQVQQMQVHISELQAQGQQFQQWFAVTGQRLEQNEAQMANLQKVVETHGQQVAHQISQIQEEVTNKTELMQGTLQSSLAGVTRDLEHSLDSKLSAQFDRFESLLAKRAKLSD